MPRDAMIDRLMLGVYGGDTAPAVSFIKPGLPFDATDTARTVGHRPWSLVVSIEFRTEREAVRFEKYLKSGSGRAFVQRHFAPEE